jgi:hypothetical protein
MGGKWRSGASTNACTAATEFQGYPSIVGGGAVYILHYEPPTVCTSTTTSCSCTEDEYHGYSRRCDACVPPSGKFSPVGYELVLAAQNRFAACRPGAFDAPTKPLRT